MGIEEDIIGRMNDVFVSFEDDGRILSKNRYAGFVKGFQAGGRLALRRGKVRLYAGRKRVSSKNFFTEEMQTVFDGLLKRPELLDVITTPHSLDILYSEISAERKLVSEDRDSDSLENFPIDFGFGYRSQVDTFGIESIDTLLVSGAQCPSSVRQAEIVMAPYHPQHIVLVDIRQEVLDLTKAIHPHVETHLGDLRDKGTLKKVPRFDVAVAQNLFSWCCHYDDADPGDISLFVDFIVGIASRMNGVRKPLMLMGDSIVLKELVDLNQGQAEAYLAQKGLRFFLGEKILEIGSHKENYDAIVSGDYSKSDLSPREHASWIFPVKRMRR